MKFYETLAKYQIKKGFHNSEEYLFFNQYRHLFSNIEQYRFLQNATKEFDVIRANIIIRSILNKKDLEAAITFSYGASRMNTEEAQTYIYEKMTNHPYILENNTKIFVPIFPKGINLLYYRDFGKLLKAPYSKLFTDYASSCIDIFETYNFALYSSLFTKFVTIHQDDDVLVVYHYDFRSLYFINSQGRLDAKIALFDRYLKKVVDNHIVQRTQGVVKAYLNDDREGVYQELIKNNLISSKLIYKIKHNEYKFHHKKESKLI